MITRVEVQKAKAQAKANKKPNYWWMLIFALVFGAVMFLLNKLISKII